jgi:inositol 2-dehydrogenase
VSGGAGRRLSVGLVGLGRLGTVYARDLATRIPETRLQAVADPARGRTEAVAAHYGVPRAYAEAERLIQDADVQAVVIVSPTETHRTFALAALASGKAVFCEKPPALTLADTREIEAAVTRSGGFLHMGLMRRFDAGYVAARKKLADGAIGKAVVFKSTSRDPFRTTLEYADPRSSGGMILDMGIHDFDLARFFMGEVEEVHAYSATLAYPELESVGDRDNAVVSLRFADGALGIVDLSRNGIYGYDIQTELLGTAGTLRIGYLRETPLLVMTQGSVAHDTVPHFMERFAAAYTAQLRDFARNVLASRPPSVTIRDGLEAVRIAAAAQRSAETGGPVGVASVTE